MRVARMNMINSHVRNQVNHSNQADYEADEINQEVDSKTR